METDSASLLLEIQDILINEIDELKETLPDSDIYFIRHDEDDRKLEPFSVLQHETITYSNFYENYILKNKPCLFEKGCTENWKAVHQWCRKSNDSDILEINYEFITQKYGESIVSVTNCDELMQNYNNLSCEPMTVKQYIEYLKQFKTKGEQSMPCLYLKDWHLLKNEKDSPYTVPLYFASDWLNEAEEVQGDDFRFAYIGPQGSWTPFHSDVYGSFSWSANIIGTKKWFLYPPGKEERFRTKLNKINFDYKNPGVLGKDYYEVIQRAGEIIFVPSGWHHMVWNLEDTISINHNWMNAANIGFIWFQLKKALVDVKKELDDLKETFDFSEICQGLLKANHGMDFKLFVQILTAILLNRKQKMCYISSYKFGPNHIQYDISIIHKLFKTMETNVELIKLLDESRSSDFREIWDNFAHLITETTSN